MLKTSIHNQTVESVNFVSYDDDPNASVLPDGLAHARLAADRDLVRALTSREVDLPLMRAALSRDARVNTTVNGFPMLHVAISRHNIAAVEMLIECGAEVDDVNDNLETALDFAYRCRFDAAIKEVEQAGGRCNVFAKGLDFNEDDRPYMLLNQQDRLDDKLLRVVKNDGADLVEHTIARGADPNMTLSGTNAAPPLLTAVVRVDLEMVRVLLNAGADPHACDANGVRARDVLWQANSRHFFTDEWLAIYDLIDDKAGKDLFTPHPRDMTLDDLREGLPLLGGKTTYLQRLSSDRRFDIVEKIIAEKSPKDRLTADDYLRQNGQGHSLLRTCMDRQQLSKVFNLDVWRGRYDDMIRLLNEVEKDPYQKHQIDGAKIRKAVVDAGLQDLAQKWKHKKIQIGKGF